MKKVYNLRPDNKGFLHDELLTKRAIMQFADKWSFTKHGVCIDIVEICGLELLMGKFGQISSIFDKFICPPCSSARVLLFQIFNF